MNTQTLIDEHCEYWIRNIKIQRENEIELVKVLIEDKQYQEAIYTIGIIEGYDRVLKELVIKYCER